MSGLLPLIMALGYGLGGSALGGTTGAVIGTGLGLGGGMLLNKKKDELEKQKMLSPVSQLYPYTQQYQQQEKRLDTLSTLALILAGLGGGYFLGGKND